MVRKRRPEIRNPGHRGISASERWTRPRRRSGSLFFGDTAGNARTTFLTLTQDTDFLRDDNGLRSSSAARM